ncbi:MAG TPA: AmmeMemoRadiSam system radical SAM enzyme [Vicinamibacteria bacterium]|nr:AmmeMemoRadiSam system radical SAM enzyme [Vicinamibacteria bacterium]
MPDLFEWSPIREATFYEALGERKVRCTACAHYCIIHDGLRGICGVRENRGGRLYSLVHGKAVACEVEPIEKKPFYHFHPGARAYSIATAGCNLHCRFCQNWQISQIHKSDFVPGFRLLPEEVVRSAREEKCRVIAYTYTEPTIFLEYALETAALAAREGLSNVFVSNGYYTTEALEAMAPLIDAVNIDLKSFRDSYYRRICGAVLQPVLDSIERSLRKGMWVEVTTLVVTGLNDSSEELRDVARYLAGLSRDIPWHVSRFFPAYRLTDREPTPEKTLRRARDIGEEEGLHHVYVGNLPGEPEDTLCPDCGEVLLERSDLRLLANHLRKGACPRCSRPLAGVGLASQAT